MDPAIAVGEVAGVMGDLIREGRIPGRGQSQATVEQIEKAHAVTPLTAVRSAFSRMERMFEKDVISLCKKRGIGFVPFSPLASGFLTGKTGKDTTYEKENIVANQPLLDVINRFAKARGVTPAQISLAWMLFREDFIVPIPGTRKVDRLKENRGVAEVEPGTEECNELERELAKIDIRGNRTGEAVLRGAY